MDWEGLPAASMDSGELVVSLDLDYFSELPDDMITVSMRT